jgi:hypothetical protein
MAAKVEVGDWVEVQVVMEGGGMHRTGTQSSL